MARIFSSEKLSLNGDNIRIRSTNANEFEITDSTESSVLLSRAGIESDFSSLNAQDIKNESDLSIDVSSLNAQDTKNESDLSIDVSSLNAQDTKNESDLSIDVSSLNAQDTKNESDLSIDVSSLNAQDTKNESDLSIDVSSLNAQDTKNESDLSIDVSSLNAQDTKNESDLSVDVSSLMAEINSTNNSIQSNDVVAVEGSPASGDGSFYIDFGSREFESDNLPAVSVTMQNGSVGDPIIGAMITEIATTGVTIVFSDDLPSANYKVKILASI